MKIYIDLWLEKIDTNTLRYLNLLGYRAVAVVDLDEKVVRKDNIVLAKKTIVEAKSRSELREKLKGIKNDSVVVSVKPLGIDAARMAAHDSRVDTIVVDGDNVKYLDKPQMSLMKQFSKPLEIPFTAIVDEKPHVRAMLFRRIKAYLHYTKLPLIVSSSASSWNELMVPRSTVSLISMLFDIDIDQTLLYITSYPREILVRNGVSI